MSIDAWFEMTAPGGSVTTWLTTNEIGVFTIPVSAGPFCAEAPFAPGARRPVHVTGNRPPVVVQLAGTPVSV